MQPGGKSGLLYSNISIFLVHLRADRPSCYFLFPRDRFSQSNPVDLPPAHQLHLHWLAIRQRHWHSRASVCAGADVYSTTQESGLMHYTRITLFIVFSVPSGRECLAGEEKGVHQEVLRELDLSHSTMIQIYAQIAHMGTQETLTVKWNWSKFRVPNSHLTLYWSRWSFHWRWGFDVSVTFLHEAKLCFQLVWAGLSVNLVGTMVGCSLSDVLIAAFW